jgi:hypothetical protein
MRLIRRGESMILRRVIENVRKQHWAGVFIELVIVVLGVFMGMQVSNWNEAQADARLGRDYVNRLTRDLNEDHAAIRAQIAYYSAVLKSVRDTDELLRAADPDPRMLVVNAYRATEITFIPPVRATWDQIVSSGHLGLLPAEAVESGLSQYYAFDIARDTYRTGLDSAYRQTVRKIIPLTMQIAMRAGCSDVRDKRGYVVGFVENCKFDADPAALKEVAAALRSNPAVIADLQYQYSFAVSAVLNLGGPKTNLEDALAALGAGPEAAGMTSP